jgi:hypothetical protein
MGDAKTVETGASVEEFIAAVPDTAKRADCRKLMQLMTDVTGEPPRMWGPSIVGFGRYHYRYASGREGDASLTGFSPRKAAISIYLQGTYFPGMETEREALLQRLGDHSMGKACLYVKRLDAIDMDVLEKLVRLSVGALRKTYA